MKCSALLRLIAIAGVGFLIVGCGKKSDDQVIPKSQSQIVAHVGDQVVTVQELDNEFRLANIAMDKKDPALVKRVLGELVVRKYLLQQALAAKLDREPSVLLDILRSREQVLENAFLGRAATSKAPSKTDIEKYVTSNPSKFSNRKILSIEQVVFPMVPGGQAFVDAHKDAKSLDEIDQQLTSAGTPHTRQMGVLNTADISQDFYNSIEARKADDVFFVRANQNGVFFKVKGEESRPLQGEAAISYARQLLRAEAIKAEAGVAAFSASLEAKYEGEYAKIMQHPDTAPK